MPTQLTLHCTNCGFKFLFRELSDDHKAKLRANGIRVQAKRCPRCLKDQLEVL